MARLGHSTVGAAMRYQHAAADRDKVIAAALSELAAGAVTPISAATGRGLVAPGDVVPTAGVADDQALAFERPHRVLGGVVSDPVLLY